MRLGSFSKQNTACLGLIHGDRTLNLTELGRRAVGNTKSWRTREMLPRCGFRQPELFWTNWISEVRASGVPAEWDRLCEPSQEL